MEKDKFVWRMLQPAESRKPHLFQTKERASLTPGQKAPESNSPSMAPKSLEKERSKLGAALRLKSKDQSARRRKISTPETYTMATVQEIPMDSREFDPDSTCAFNWTDMNQPRYPAWHRSTSDQSVPQPITGGITPLEKLC
jgi:hypothetical protein